MNTWSDGGPGGGWNEPIRMHVVYRGLLLPEMKVLASQAAKKEREIA